MRRASLASISIASILIVAKGLAWVVTDSVSMLSSLVDSALDLVSSLITFMAIRQALVPADKDHRFGHGKAEALAGVAQAGFIAASAGGLLLTVVDRFLHPHPVQAEAVGLAVSAFALVLTFGLMLFQSHVVRRTNSIAIGADKAHYTTDFVTNIAVGAGIVATVRLQEPLIDLAVALGIAVYLVTSAWTIGRTSIDVLMDRELPDAERQRVLETVRRHGQVKGIHDLRTRSAGLTKFIQLHIELDPALSFVDAHAIGDRIEAEIEEAFPDAEIILHVDPTGIAERHPRDTAG